MEAEILTSGNTNLNFIEIQFLLRGSAGTAQKTGTRKLMSLLAFPPPPTLSWSRSTQRHY